MLILNEKKYAEDLYFGKNNEVKSVTAKVRYITRYLLYVCSYDDADNYTDTVEWMKKNHDNFDESCYSNLIADAIKKAHKQPFFNIESIQITKSELDIISSLNNLRAEKILFVLLCMAKQQRMIYGFTNGLVRYSLPDLCKTARISVPTEEREYILYQIMQKGYLECPKKNDTKCLIVNFIDDSEDIVLNLDENKCRELAYEYLSWKNNGVGYFHCEFCGRSGKQRKNNPRRFCKECTELLGDVPDDIKVIKCKDCGKPVYISIFDDKTIRCENCQRIADHPPMGKKIIECVDCHKEFEINSKDNNTIRCECCNLVYQKKRNAEKNKIYRECKKHKT